MTINSDEILTQYIARNNFRSSRWYLQVEKCNKMLSKMDQCNSKSFDNILSLEAFVAAG